MSASRRIVNATAKSGYRGGEARLRVALPTGRAAAWPGSRLQLRQDTDHRPCDACDQTASPRRTANMVFGDDASPAEMRGRIASEARQNAPTDRRGIYLAVEDISRAVRSNDAGIQLVVACQLLIWAISMSSTGPARSMLAIFAGTWLPADRLPPRARCRIRSPGHAPRSATTTTTTSRRRRNDRPPTGHRASGARSPVAVAAPSASASRRRLTRPDHRTSRNISAPRAAARSALTDACRPTRAAAILRRGSPSIIRPSSSPRALRRAT